MRLAPLALALLLAPPVHAEEVRSRAVAREFQRLHPCPSTGLQTGACPGYVKDHMRPLCAGGADATWNMQWQTVEDAKVKDRWERAICRHHGDAFQAEGSVGGG